MNRNGNIVSMRPTSSVDSVQERFYLFIFRKEKLKLVFYLVYLTVYV